jgi:hypothetical protein
MARRYSLVKEDPLDIWPPLVASAVRALPIEWDLMIPGPGPWPQHLKIVVGYIQREADRQAALARVRAALKPAPPDEIDHELVRLRLSTAPRQETVADLTMQYEIYHELCAEYPGYTMRDALRYLGRTEKWFPTLSEVEEELKYRADKMRLLGDALEHPERYRPPPSPDWELANNLINLVNKSQTLEELVCSVRSGRKRRIRNR